jgi:hypothetical protein
MTENVWVFASYKIQRRYYAPRLVELPLENGNWHRKEKGSLLCEEDLLEMEGQWIET